MIGINGRLEKMRGLGFRARQNMRCKWKARPGIRVRMVEKRNIKLIQGKRLSYSGGREKC